MTLHLNYLQTRRGRLCQFIWFILILSTFMKQLYSVRPLETRNKCLIRREPWFSSCLCFSWICERTVLFSVKRDLDPPPPPPLPPSSNRQRIQKYGWSLRCSPIPWGWRDAYRCFDSRQPRRLVQLQWTENLPDFPTFFSLWNGAGWWNQEIATVLWEIHEREFRSGMDKIVNKFYESTKGTFEQLSARHIQERKFFIRRENQRKSIYYFWSWK